MVEKKDSKRNYALKSVRKEFFCEKNDEEQKEFEQRLINHVIKLLQNFKNINYFQCILFHIEEK